MIPTKFGVGLFPKFLSQVCGTLHIAQHLTLLSNNCPRDVINSVFLAISQGGALVHVYTDGSVLLTHGGVEMGQGLHTKMVQVCARALGIPPSKVHISEMATNTVANASATAASASSDLYGMAVKRACEQIRERLAPYMEANLKGTWEDWV